MKKSEKLPIPTNKNTVQSVFDSGYQLCSLVNDLERVMNDGSCKDFDRVFKDIRTFRKKASPTCSIKYMDEIRKLYRKMYGKSPDDF